MRTSHNELLDKDEKPSSDSSNDGISHQQILILLQKGCVRPKGEALFACLHPTYLYFGSGEHDSPRGAYQEAVLADR